ncbi:exostosin family protein [Aphelenchoides avenae]|nr:exostosin family protein [Aphelenchus avenae]
MLALDAMQFGVVPVIISNTFVPPFSDELHWPRFSLHFADSMVDQVPTVLANVHIDTWRRMSQKARWAYARYMSSLKRIVLTSLTLLEGRILPGRSRSFEEWNGASTYSSEMRQRLPWRVTGERLTAILLLMETTQYFDAHMKLVTHLKQRINSIFVMASPDAALSPVTSLPTVTVMRSASGGPLKQLMSKHESQMSEAVVIIDLNRAPTISPTMLDEGLELWQENADHIVHLRGPATANDGSERRKKQPGSNAMMFCSKDLLGKYLDDVLDSSSTDGRLCYDMQQNTTRTAGRTSVDNILSYTLCSFAN